MVVIIYYQPPAPMTRAIKKRLRRLGLRYRVGHLGEMMEENYNQARRHGTLRYRAEHLRLLRGVEQNPAVVDIAFEVLTERLAEKGVPLPDVYDERLPHDPDYVRIIAIGLALAVAMTALISAAIVLFDDRVALMTTLIVAVSIGGAAVAIWLMPRQIIPVDPTRAAPEDETGRPSERG